MTREHEELLSAVRSAFARVLNDDTLSFGDRVEKLRRVRSLFHSELAQAFQPSFNAELQAMPRSTLSSKRDLCATANDTLRTLGLTINSCRHPGRHAILVADAPTPEDDRGRFRLEVWDECGRTRDWSNRDLIPLELGERSTRAEPLSSRYRDRRSTSRDR